MVRFVDSEGESESENGDGLAPVTSLLRDRDAKAYPKTAADVRHELERRTPKSHDGAGASRVPAVPRSPSAVEWRSEWADSGSGDAPASLADPIDLDAARTGRSRSAARRAAAPTDSDDSTDAAERGLLKKLRARQLSVSEAKTYLAQHDLDSESVDAVLEAFLERGYLDDARLAEQVVHAGVDRKNQGRQAIAQSLAKRGVRRDVADAALAELPDDDADRALEFARTKAGSMRGLERDVALRRLAGQLARRGYGGSAALSAARQALDEVTRPTGRVRFE